MQKSFWISNPTTRPVAIAQATTSCDCFKVIIENRFITPGERVLANATIDFHDDPRFVGHLQLGAEATVEDEKTTAFAITARVRVVANTKATK